MSPSHFLSYKAFLRANIVLKNGLFARLFLENGLFSIMMFSLQLDK